MTSGMGVDLLLLGVIVVWLWGLRYAARIERERGREWIPRAGDVSELDLHDWPNERRSNP